MGQGIFRMRTVAWAGMILGMSLMLCGESTAAEQVKQDYVENAYLSLKMGQYKQPPEAFKKLAKVETADAETYFRRGLAHEKRGDNEKAIKYYTQALQIKPKMETAFNNRGVVYYRQREYRKAIKDFSQAIDLNPAYALVYYNRGNVYGALGDLERALVDFNQSIRINPDNASAYNNRGWIKLQKKQTKGSIIDFNRALQINPRYTLAFCNRGNARLRIGDSNGSFKDFSSAKELDPRLAGSYFTNIPQHGYANIDEFLQDNKKRVTCSYKVDAWDIFENTDCIPAGSGAKREGTLYMGPTTTHVKRNGNHNVPNEAVLNFLAEWKSAWERKDIATYGRMYVPDFVQGDMDYKTFVMYKQYLFRKYRNIRVETTEVQAQKVGNEIMLDFMQSFQGDDYQDNGWKKLILTPDEETEYKIVQEEWTPVRPVGRNTQ